MRVAGTSESVPLAEQLAAFGYFGPVDEPEAERPLEIMPEIEGSLRLLDACATQWRRHPFTGALQGIDYAAALAVAGWLGLVPDPQLLADLRVLEDEVLSIQPRQRRPRRGGRLH